ncbi:MAG: tRNA dihydrouridine synthase [Blautia sp.]
MKIYMAPLEEVTEYIYRNAYHAFFSPMDKYFAPFIAAKQNKGRLFNYKEKKNILPENNRGIYLVPQILTNNSNDFLRTVKGLEEYGYKEVNLNLGCPSRPVVSGGRGAGFLERREELDRFFSEIFEGTQVKISVKTRVGRYEPEEIGPLMDIFCQYPIEELIVHPRVQQDYYRGKTRKDAFQVAWKRHNMPLVYNGDIFTEKDYKQLLLEFPKIDGVMLGRGVLADPGLTGKIRGEQGTSMEQWKGFLEKLYEDFTRTAVNEEKALFKLKEIWCYLRYSFPEVDVWNKKIKRSRTLEEYKGAVEGLIDTYPGVPGGSYQGNAHMWEK